MVVRAGIDQEETESSDFKKKQYEILVYHENLHPQFLNAFLFTCFCPFFSFADINKKNIQYK